MPQDSCLYQTVPTSSKTMSSCLLGLETVQTSTLLRICGHDWRGWWCRSDRATRPASLKQSSARGSELLLLLNCRKLWTRCLELEGVRLSSKPRAIQRAVERYSRLVANTVCGLVLTFKSYIRHCTLIYSHVLWCYMLKVCYYITFTLKTNWFHQNAHAFSANRSMGVLARGSNWGCYEPSLVPVLPQPPGGVQHPRAPPTLRPCSWHYKLWLSVHLWHEWRRFCGETICIVQRDRKVDVAPNWVTVYFQKWS